MAAGREIWFTCARGIVNVGKKTVDLDHIHCRDAAARRLLGPDPWEKRWLEQRSRSRSAAHG